MRSQRALRWSGPMVVLLAAVVRVWRLGWPRSFVWDEVYVPPSLPPNSTFTTLFACHLSLLSGSVESPLLPSLLAKSVCPENMILQCLAAG